MNERVQIPQKANERGAIPLLQSTRSPYGMLQRKCACGGSAGSGGECEECKKKQALQRRAAHSGGPTSVPPIVHEVLHSPGQPLDPQTRAFFEPRFGHDFSKVRIHADARAADSARAVDALAYTVGPKVVFGAGQYRPDTSGGRQLLAHELTHVVQQRSHAAGGPVAQAKLEVGREGDVHEQEADRTAEHVMRGPVLGEKTSSTPAPPKVQRQTTGGTTGSTAPCPFPSDFKTSREAEMAMLCVAGVPPNTPPTCALTDKHLQLLNVAQQDAKQRVEKADFRIHATGGPEFVQRVAKHVFTDEPPTTDEIKATLDKMQQILGGHSIPFAGGTCTDPNCEPAAGRHTAAYEQGPGKPVVFCPRSFLPDHLSELPGTIVHEAVHLSGIDVDPNTEERYCLSSGCDTPCQSKASADAWARLIDCIGGPLNTSAPAQIPPSSTSGGTP